MDLSCVGVLKLIVGWQSAGHVVGSDLLYVDACVYVRCKGRVLNSEGGRLLLEDVWLNLAPLGSLVRGPNVTKHRANIVIETSWKHLELIAAIRSLW